MASISPFIGILPVAHGGAPGFKSPVTSMQSPTDRGTTVATAPNAFASIFASLGLPGLARGATPQPVASKNDLAGTSSGGATSQVVSQVTGLLQSGVPLSSIIARLSSIISAALHRALPQGMASVSGQIDSSLLQSLTNALSPPAHAPPGTAAEQAATLVAQLQQWLSGVAGVAQGQAGQQSDISGSILDTTSVKETPAQHDTQRTSNFAFDAASLAQSLLATVTASLSPSVSSSPQTAQNAATLVPSAPAHGADTAISSVATSTPAPANGQTAAPDLLARMIVRASSVDAQLNAPAIAAAASEATSQATAAATRGDGTLSTPSMLAARFAAALATTVGVPASGSSSDAQTSTWTGSGFGTGRDTSRTASARSTTDQPSLALGALPTVAMQTQAQQAAMPATPALPDPTAIVEQVVKGMAMRSLSNGTSEIRLRLFPENLGEVSMKLTIAGSSVNASIVAQNSTVQSALVNGHQQLARSLNEAGLTLSGFSVDVSGGDAGNGGNKDRASGFGRHYVIHELPGSPEAIAATGPSSSPSIVNGSTLELFNYLV